MVLNRLFDRFRGKPTIDGFARDLILGMRAAGDPSELLHKPDEGRISRRTAGKPAGHINLGNMFATYLAKPAEERADYLRNCVRSALLQFREIPGDFDAARPDLRPRVWSRLALEKTRLELLIEGQGMDASQLPSRPVGEHIVATLGYDWPEAVQSIGQAKLDGWGVTFDEAMEVALGNLRESTQGYAQVGEGFYAFVSGDSYDATRLLLADHIAGLQVAGSHVAMAPNRDQLLITGSEDEAGLKMLAGMGEESLSEPYPLSGAPMIFEDGEWSDWLPPEGHPLRRLFLDIRTQWLGPQYAEHKQLIEAVQEKQGVDLFVASLSALKKEGGGITTYCVWGEGVDSLLPESDKVVFASEAGIVARGDWDRVRAVVGHLMGPTEHYPPRHLVRAFPDEAAIAALGLGEM